MKQDGVARAVATASEFFRPILTSNIEGVFFLEVITLYILFGMDIATTAVVLSAGGSEMNTLMTPVVGNTFIHLLVKGVILVFVVSVARWAELKIHHSGVITMGIIIIWYAWVLFNNFCILMGMLFPEIPGFIS